MTRQHTTHRRLARQLVRRLRPAPERFAAAAALQNPGLLLQLQAADEPAEGEPSDPSPSGLHVDQHLLASAATSPITWGMAR